MIIFINSVEERWASIIWLFVNINAILQFWKIKKLYLQLPSRHLFVQSQQRKHWNNVWNLFEINNKHTRTLLMTFIINFEQISHECSGLSIVGWVFSYYYYYHIINSTTTYFIIEK